MTLAFPTQRGSVRHWRARSRARCRELIVALAAGTALGAFAQMAPQPSPQTTTLGTRGTLAAPNPAVTANAGATWPSTGYTRGPDHPRAVTLPLQFIRLSSGKQLAVLVSMPADFLGFPKSGRYPVVLTQTAYRIDVGQFLGVFTPAGGNTLLIGGLDQFMVRRGYVTVAIDAHGTGMSGGVTQLIGPDEQQAYREAVDWVTRQSFFNGSIGVAGTSYLGISSLLTAGQQHPAIKAAFATVPMGDAYRGVAATGGLFNAQFLSTWLPLTQSLSVANAPELLLNPWFASQINAATGDHVAAIDTWYAPTFDGFVGNASGIATDDGSFWAGRSPVESAGRIRVPTFIVGASLDIFQRDQPLLYEQLKRNVTAKLAILPGSHLQSVQGGIAGFGGAPSYGPPSTTSLLLQWFDQYLKGRAAGADTLPTVTQFVDGYGSGGTPRFATASDWPHPRMAPQRWYLQPDGSLTSRIPATEAGRTISEPPAPTATRGTVLGTIFTAGVQIRDHSDCSASQVQWTLGLAGLLPKPCYSDSARVESLQGAAVYETAPLAQDLYLNGPIQADLWISASRPQAALSVRIDDVDPSTGAVKPLTHGLMSAAHRAVDTSRSRFVNGTMIQPWHPFTAGAALPVVANEPMLVPVEVFPVAALVRAGHRLRIAVSASNQAQGIWPTPLQQQANGNVTTIHAGPLRPSSLVLPVVPAGELN
ncbi:CocE/NonD family hydrolase [Mitsuaria sp. CC2]|uniref:CocE/NonD family hydrolase n=1 Tax=Mitsuaria sp. CC2 TaxID=3029186 RepID=UPI003B8AA43F